MATRCLQGPQLPTPQLPSTFSLTPPDFPNIGIDINLALCCKLPPIPLHVPKIPIPGLVATLPIIETINAYIKQATDYVASLHLDCPLE